MRQKKGEGTKIAQAAKELGVTSVTIRRYITEFNIETTADENGIKVLPSQAMDELQEIRKLKEEGLTNPKVLEILEESRTKTPASKASKAKEDKKEEKEKPEPATPPKRAVRKSEAAAVPPAARRKAPVVQEEPEEEEEEAAEEEAEEPVAEQKGEEEQEKDDAPIPIPSADGKSKYSLTCQTCQKTFEHMNPRLRDCLDCYRIKRKERRRGGDKQRNVIQNPIAQQVVNKNQQAQLARGEQQAGVDSDFSPAESAAAPVVVREAAAPRRPAEPRKVSVRDQLNFAPVGTTPSVYQRTQVRSYRKAIEETRGITSNLKRRLERPDLPEAERRFLEQIYAYQLILHQGWKHLAEYRQMDSGTGSSSGGGGSRSHDS